MLLVINPGRALKWQGTGNLNNNNLSVIWTYINNNFQTSWNSVTVTTSGDTTLKNFVTGLSDHLNSQWDPAWNVFVIQLINNAKGDTVLYGYAFRNRWMWYNGVKLDDGNLVSFIIWKDYNSVQWRTYYETDLNLQTRSF